MTTHTAQATFLSTARYTLVVTLICYLPHFITAPWWLLAVVFTAITYRLIADYFGYPLLHLLTRVGLVTICFILLQSQYSSILSSGFFISFLLIFIALKIVEIHHMRDIKVLIFCNFYLIFSALLVIQELWIIIYLLIAILANLALMLKISAPKASLKQIGGKSTKQLLIAIPLSILLFYLFPRIANPLWSVPLVSQSHVGFSERMSPGSIADLFKDDSTAFRVTFNSKPILNGYWRGLILSFYNGVSWNPTWFSGNSPPLAELKSDASADYEIILEPHQKKWLFYTGTPVAGRPDLLFSSSLGLISNEKEIITDRFAYALKIQNQPGYNPLKPEEVTKYTQLPRTFNPRLKQWANAEYVKVNKDPKAFIRFLSHYINQQSFWYTLSPPAANSRNQMDYFWFDS